jgi:FtsZ-binding cell division protein ZapB
VEDDLPAPAAEPEPEPEREPEPEPDRPVPAVTVGPPTSTVLTPATAGQHAQVAGLIAEINSLTTLLDRERREAQRLSRDASRAREEAQRLRRQVKSLKDQHQAYRDRIEGAGLFSDPEEQLRYEIHQTWLRRIAEPERVHRPLSNYRLGPAFLDSLSTLEGINRDKVLDVLVEVLTDRAKDISGRDLHQLRESESSQIQRNRSDGARAWRCALQVNTPAARRLHFWKLPDNIVELDRIGTHDEGL